VSEYRSPVPFTTYWQSAAGGFGAVTQWIDFIETYDEESDDPELPVYAEPYVVTSVGSFPEEYFEITEGQYTELLVIEKSRNRSNMMERLQNTPSAGEALIAAIKDDPKTLKALKALVK
jgi:hypothetical protein